MSAIGALALQLVRAPINLTADLMGLSAALCNGARTRSLKLGEDLYGIEALAPDANENHIILYFHGGGHWLLTANAYREFIGRLSLATQARVVAVEYQKPPSARVPAGLEDVMNAYRWAIKQPGASVAVAGDSSGANLAFALLVKLAYIRERQPVACIGISPWLRLDMPNKLENWYGKFCVNLYLGPKGQRVISAADPLVSPVNTKEEVVREHFPPILLHAGQNELTTEDVKEMAALLERAGKPAEVKFYPAPHIFQVTAGFPESTRDSLSRIGEFLATRWVDGAGAPN